MTRPQTDREEMAELSRIAKENRLRIDGRVDVGTPDEFVALTPEQMKARNRRNLVIALSIAGFVILVFFVSIARMHANSVAGAAG